MLPVITPSLQEQGEVAALLIRPAMMYNNVLCPRLLPLIGIVRRLRARGGVEVSFLWARGEVAAGKNISFKYILCFNRLYFLALNISLACSAVFDVEYVHNMFILCYCTTAAIINVPAWHPAFRPVKEESRGFFKLEQETAALSLTLIFPNLMTAVRVSVNGDDVISANKGSNSGSGSEHDKFDEYFHELPKSHEVHSSFPALKGDRHHTLKLPSPKRKTGYPFKLVSNNMLSNIAVRILSSKVPAF